MSAWASRFPLLEHLSWSRHPARIHHLAGSAIPVPPPEVFDPQEGPVMVDPLVGGELEMAGLVSARYRVPEERILLTSGLSEGLYLACAALLEPGDFAVVEAPGYQSLAGVARAAGSVVRPLARGLDGSLDAGAAVDSIARAADEARAAGRRLALVIVSDLHNPTGARVPDADVDRLAEASRRAGATLLMDEVYRDVDASRPIGTSQSRHPDMIALSSVTKAYGLGGIRMGWLMAPVEIRDACSRVQLHISVNPSGPSIGIGIRALRAADRILEWARPVLEENRQTLVAALYDRPSGFTLPAGASVGTTAFAFRPNGPDTMKEVVAWRETREVAVVPGAWFGAPSGVRIGLGKPPAAFRTAIEAWQLALAEPARA